MKCIARLDDGRLCGQPATAIDLTRGGMVCSAHRPRAPVRKKTDEEICDELAKSGGAMRRLGEFGRQR